MKTLILLCSVMLAVVGPTEGAAPSSDATNVVSLVASDNGKTVAAQVGQQITITLKGNPTTGYLWSVAGFSSNAVEQVGEVEYRRDEAGKHRVGSGGVFAVTFQAARPGKSTVRLEYRRPWEKDVDPIEKFNVTLDVAQ